MDNGKNPTSKGKFSTRELFSTSAILNLIFVERGCRMFGKQCFLRNALLLIALGSPFLWKQFGTGFLNADIVYLERKHI